MNDINKLVSNLNHKEVKIRLSSLQNLMDEISAGRLEKVQKTEDVNNHIHTFYSFSPYSPSKAIWMSYLAGLQTAGIMDHDSISGSAEFIEAGRIAKIAVTSGMECRVDFSKTSLAGKRINHPDQLSIAYIAVHGIPHQKWNETSAYLKPLLNGRKKRNILMVSNINDILKPFNFNLNYKNDILPLSRYNEGGSVTERHILFGLSKAIISRYGKGERLVNFLIGSLKLKIPDKLLRNLMDEQNIYYEYDLLGVFKGEFIARFYIPAISECPDISELLAFVRSIGAISAYPYLGDVGESVTGDKKPQKFEDDYLDLLFEILSELGFNAVTYAPSRNTIGQIIKIKSLCEHYGFFQISGEDINSPRQSFVCEAMRGAEFKNLASSAWALIGHEKAASIDIHNGMFSEDLVNKYPDLEERIEVFKKIGQKTGVC